VWEGGGHCAGLRGAARSVCNISLLSLYLQQLSMWNDLTTWDGWVGVTPVFYCGASSDTDLIILCTENFTESLTNWHLISWWLSAAYCTTGLAACGTSGLAVSSLLYYRLSCLLRACCGNVSMTSVAAAAIRQTQDRGWTRGGATCRNVCIRQQRH
jgi:hypothetical protein